MINKAIILAGGKSTRTYPFTLDRPKGLLKVCNIPIIEYTLKQLQNFIKEIFIVVNYKEEMIIDYFRKNNMGFDIIFIHQNETIGTGNAILEAKEALKNKTLILNGDDIYSKKDIEQCIKCEDYSVLGQKVNTPERFGILQTDNKNYLKKLVEKPKEYVGDLANIGVYTLDNKIFDCNIQISTRGEYEITDYVSYLAQNNKVKVHQANDLWIPIAYPIDLYKANFILFDKLGYKELLLGKNCQISKNISFKGKNIIENNVIIEDNVKIENSIICDGSIIKRGENIKNAIVTNNVKLEFRNLL